MNAADTLMLSRITAALNAGPFLDPVTVLGIAIPRKDARRFERELTAKFSEQLNVSHFHRETVTSQEQHNHGF